MIHEKIHSIKDKIETLLITNEVQFKSIKVAHYREASYFAFDGSFVYVIVDCSFSGSAKMCYVGETSNLGPNLRMHARNHRFSHAFVIDMWASDKETRVLAKDLLAKELEPIFQNKYYSFEAYCKNNIKRECSTREISKWNEGRLVKQK